MTTPVLNCRRTTPPSVRFRNSAEMREKSGISFISCAVRGAPGIFGCTPAEYVIAPVGQETMHHPQLTQVLSPIGLLLSNEMLVRFPLPIRPMTKFWATSVQARTHRSQTIQALWSIATEGLE